jgi:hypothetical protein
MTHQDAVATLAAERYLLDEMTLQDRETFEDHYFQCEECAEDLRDAAAMLRGVRAGLGERGTGHGPGGQVVSIAEGRAARRAPWYRSTALPWAMAATLALVAGYESLRTTPAQLSAGPMAIEPVTLRAASRGAEPVVHLGSLASGRGSQPVAFAIDLAEAPQDGQLAYDLSTADGRSVAAGVVPAPAAGAPLLLVMPSWTAVASMHYILTVHDAGQPGRLLGEYRFAASDR